MYEFWRAYVKVKYCKKKAKYCHKDTESFIVYFTDICKDIAEDAEA